jgi:hypothetical protein
MAGPSGPALRVDLDLAGVAPGMRSHVAYTLRGERLTGVVVDGTGANRPVHLEIGAWPGELERRLLLSVPPDAPTPPARVVELPWDLLVGTGEALARHRGDVYDELLAREVEAVHIDGVVAGLVDAHEQLRRLHHSVLGRLQVVGSGHSPSGTRRIGWICWLRFADGWRALTPYTAGAGGTRRAMVRVEPRRATDLATQVARWAFRVRR